MLQSHIRILHVSLLQTDMEMTAKYGNQQYVVSLHCVSINGPGDLDFWPWNYNASRIEGGA